VSAAAFGLSDRTSRSGPAGALRWSARITAVVLVLIAGIGRVQAHPLGNFTINHLARLQPEAGRLRVHYVLDIAEIPTFQIMHAVPAWTPKAMRDWQNAEASLVASGLSIRANGSALLPLHVDGTTARTRSGAGGLPILYWTGDYTAPLPARATISVRDSVYGDRRIGWKDILLPGLADPTDELRSYPSALIGSPRQNDAATFDLLGAGRIARVHVSGDGVSRWDSSSIVRSSVLSDLFARDGQTPVWILLTILAAFGLGALHGLEPGHGKALLAFTLVGARATFKQAVILAGALTFAHTIAVLLLGLVLFFVAGFATESLFTWITLISGVAVAAIGARGLAVAVTRVTQQREHAHAHEHGLEHRHDHSHSIPGTSRLHFPSAVVAAMSGGIAPCPAAIVVLLTALRLHRVGYGLFLIVVFSLGLAAILTGLGIAVVHGAAWLQRRSGFGRIAHAAPFLTSIVISTIGSVMVGQALVQRGVPVSASGIALVVFLGVALYATVSFALFSSRSTHRILTIKETT
jgi:nickel/cobalt transporter (NicO) family protein